MACAMFSDERSIPHLIAEMTLIEKARFTTGCSRFGAMGLERLGIPFVKLIDGSPGINFNQLFHEYVLSGRSPGDSDVYAATSKLVQTLKDGGVIDGDKLTGAEKRAWDIISRNIDECFPDGRVEPTAFPVGMLLGATWSPEAARAVGEAAGREFDAYKIDIMLGPNINIHRDPLNGRLFEGYSEDPRLVEKLAPEFVKGVQSAGVAAEPKHFAANNQESARMNGDEVIPTRALREIYLPGFRACVCEGGAKTIMSAYNKINGTACAMNKALLTDILRDEWGFDGMVVSDWGAVYDQIEALLAGNDLEMPRNASVDAVIDAVSDGRLDERVLDRAIERQLKCLLKLPATTGHKFNGIDEDFSREAAYSAAAEGMVLLKNNGSLPLSKEGKVSFMGEGSLRFLECGAGSAQVITKKTSSLFVRAQEKLGTENAVYSRVDRDSNAVVVTVRAGGQEGKDRKDLGIDSADRQILMSAISEAKKLAIPVALILNVSGPVDMRDFIDDCDAILCAFLPGSEGGRAACDILFGDVNPSGKLPLTFPVRYKDCPSYLNFPGYGGRVWYGEGIYVGYRWYEARDIKPAFAFGHGLSYTKFELSDFICENGALDADADSPVRFTVRLKNVGDRAGREVVQLYVSHPNSTLPKPVKELKAFKKVSLSPREETTLEFELHKCDVSSFDDKLNAFTAETGEYIALIGFASDDIRLSTGFRVIGKNPYGLSARCPIGKALSDLRCVAVFNQVFDGIVKASAFDMRMDVSPEWELREMFDYFFKGKHKERIEEFYKKIEALD